MSKKHFTDLANRLRALRPDTGNKYAPRMVTGPAKGALAQWIETVKEMASFCQDNNPRFDRDKFMAACGLCEE